MTPTTYAIIVEGEGATAVVVTTADIHTELHKEMCFCKKPWKECKTEGIKSDIEKIDDDDEWSNDETGERFSIIWRSESGSIRLYIVSRIIE